MRLGVVFDPPAFMMEYQRDDGELRVRTAPVLHAKRDDGSVVDANDIVELLRKEDADYFGSGGVPEDKLRDLAEKLVEALRSGPSTDQNYNKLDDDALERVKDKMSVGFEANVVKPGDPGYEYDTRKEFKPASEPSGWDDSEDDDTFDSSDEFGL